MIESIVTALLRSVKNTFEIDDFLVRDNFGKYLDSQLSKFTKGYNPSKNDESGRSFLDMYYPLTISNGFHKTKLTNLTDELKKIPYLALVGDAGSGKSTFLKYVFVKSIKEKYKVPILLELRNCNHLEKIFIEEILLDNINIFGNLVLEDFRKLLISGRFLLLFDGYDEVNPNLSSQVISQIEKLVDKYPKNNYIITSRPGLNIGRLPRFSPYNVESLSHKDIRSFSKVISSYKDLKHEKVYDFISYIENLNQSNRDLFITPLLFTTMFQIFQAFDGLPKQKSKLYQLIFQTMMSGHDAVANKNFYRKNLSSLSNSNFQKIVSGVAFVSYFKFRNTIDDDDINRIFNAIKNKGQIEFDNDKVLFDMRVTYNVLTKNLYSYSFLNVDMQGYLAATHVVELDKSKKNKFYKDILTKKLNPFVHSNPERNIFLDVLYEIDTTSFISFYLKYLVEAFLKVDMNSKLQKFSVVEDAKSSEWHFLHPEYWWLLHHLDLNDELTLLYQLVLPEYFLFRREKSDDNLNDFSLKNTALANVLKRIDSKIKVYFKNLTNIDSNDSTLLEYL